MSLIKQLWLGITVLMLLAFGGSFVLSALSAKQYLEQQIQVKDLDNVTTLALSMSQLDKDLVTLELLIAAQFDAGHYEQIVLRDTQGEPIIARFYEGGAVTSAPRWFREWISLDTEPATALVQDGWQQFGELILESHSGFYVDSLWTGTLRLVQWFLILGLVSGLLGTLFLRSVSRPMDMVVGQAEAIGARRFIHSKEPRTREFRRLVKAMNTLSGRVKAMLEKEQQQLESLRRRVSHDDLTGLPNREHFMGLLNHALSDPKTNQAGTAVMVRLMALQAVNVQLGRQETDQLLQRLADCLAGPAQAHAATIAGRMNGSDFALIIPSRYEPEPIIRTLRHQLDDLIMEYTATAQVNLPMAVCEFHQGIERGALLMQLDGALAQAEQQGGKALVRIASESGTQTHRNLTDWRTSLEAALADTDHTLALARYPVVSLEGTLLHYEAPVTLKLDNKVQPALYFVPWLARLGMLPDLDLKVVQHALALLEDQDQRNALRNHPIAVNVSAESLVDAAFRHQLIHLLNQHAGVSQCLALEFHEFCAVRHAQEFRALCEELKQLRCTIGLEHVGPDFSRIEDLQNLGLDFIKIDGSLIRDIQHEPGNQTYVRGICTIGHSLGISMLAQGVSDLEEQAVLAGLGLDGMTGPGAQEMVT